MSTARRGFTLLEALAATTLSFLALSVLVAVVIPAFRASAHGQARLEMEREASLALRRIGQEIRRSLPAGLALRQSDVGTALSIHKVSGVTLGDPPLQIYSNQLVLYVFRKQQGTLYRQTWPAATGGPKVLPSGIQPPDGSAPLQPGEVDLDLFLGLPATGALQSSGVAELTVSNPRLNPISLSIKLERRLPGRSQPTHFALTRVVSLRNAE